MKSLTRMVVAFTLSTIIGLALSLANGRGLTLSVSGSVSFALIAAAVVGILSVGEGLAESKGYPGWVGLLAVGAFIVPGLILLALLPERMPSVRDRTADER